MSSHYIYVQCVTCLKTESLYTGDIYSDEFEDDEWEGEFIQGTCNECKADKLKENK